MNISICCIAYNRVDSLKRLLNSLEQADYGVNKPTLIISIDKSSTAVVEKYANEYCWKFGDKIVYTHSENLGLRKHVLECGTHLEDYDAMVVLEDDITVSPYFFQYTVQCVEKYSNDERIAGISLYNFPVSYHTKLPFKPVKSEYDVFMMNCAQSWGQVWMKNQWRKFKEWYEKNSEEFNKPDLPQSINSWPKSSWLKYHTRYCIEHNKFFVYPYEALSTNNNDVGTHVKDVGVNIFQSSLQLLSKPSYKLPIFEECIVKYDGFFEPLFLASWLEVDSEKLCVDINGLKNMCLFKRYLLSRKGLPYKIIKSYSINLKPIEANILFDNKGSSLFLYDTHINTGNSLLVQNNGYLEYLYGFSLTDLLHRYGAKNLSRMFIAKILHKIKKYIKNGGTS